MAFPDKAQAPAAILDALASARARDVRYDDGRLFALVYGVDDEHARLLAAAYRHLGHWAELIGGDVILSMPYEWALKANASEIVVKERIDEPVRPEIVQALYDRIPDFRRSYDELSLAWIGPIKRRL